MKRLLASVMALSLVAGGCSASADGETVVVLASWTGAEGDAFRQVLDAFKADTGIGYLYQGTRAVDQVLASDVQRGTPPDVAVLPNAGVLAKYQKSGDLLPLDDEVSAAVTRSFSPQWVTLQKIGTQKLYAVAVKADLKSVIWYNPARLTGIRPTTFDGLRTYSAGLTAAGGTPWCVGMGAPPTSGWPGTDWIEDILLHSAGPDKYWQWASGSLEWTSPEVRQAWLDWGSVLEPAGIRGGTAAALLTDFGDAGKPMFADPPGCVLEHQPSFIMSRYQNLKRADGTAPRPGTDFDFLNFPGRDVSEVGADLAGMFRDTPQARKLIQYLASEKAQRIWPSIPRASAFSANRGLGLDVYTDPVSRKVADTITSAQALCFDASDLMPATMTGAFHRAVLEYLSNRDRLDILLKQLDDVRKSIQPGEWLKIRCGQ
ncbi:ABC transporter substrate-binding protein [Amycolatopsis coloradensis]|uniref:ABC transporter substrate-binding protein n=1 Tax=Amycolatopsis coloradensis TaxID=76021 RepID=A0A1R0KYA6_9PSEU|nr:ABC transporter substrate-binding protein [Amycolatopsis coloradensis]OLZ54412.1 ABC transporter substrate-binding protein [Amycolatopsis coloradensis]